MSKFTLRLDVSEEEIIGSIQSERNIATKSGAVKWLISNYPDVVRMVEEIQSLRVENAAKRQRLIRINSLIEQRDQIEKTLREFCTKDQH